uniref:39S ribosomal protein L35, mitochondrial n=1 Tax=Dracunculus medinensis TaxID=318479 RepID=A0A0N4U6E2_DRAME
LSGSFAPFVLCMSRTVCVLFDPKEGRKRPAQDVLDRFKRLNSGMWIRCVAGRNKLRYAKNETFQTTSLYYETCTKEQCFMLDRMMTPFWLRPKYYVNDPYEPYHVRHGLTSVRTSNGKLKRERPKILLEDCIADKYFSHR